MKRGYRIKGMIVCLVILLISGTLLVTFSDDNLHELGALLAMFVSGWGLRETLDNIGENENATVKE